MVSPSGRTRTGYSRRMSQDRNERPQDLVADALSRIWQRSRSEAGNAARWARERLTLRQLRADRDRMYQKLGKEARHLHEAGELDHPGIARGVGRIKDLEAKITDLEDQLRAVGLEPEPENP